jgi:hypothetical protein
MRNGMFGTLQDRDIASRKQNDDASETVTIVTTPLELVIAISRSHPHIELREHINFVGFHLLEGQTHVLGDIPTGVLSIQVRLSSPQIPLAIGPGRQ